MCPCVISGSGTFVSRTDAAQPPARTHVDFEVSFRREGSAAGRALERLVPRVGPHVDLESGVTGKRLEADRADVLGYVGRALR